MRLPRGWIAFLLFALALFVYLFNYRYRIWGAGGDTTPAELLPIAIERNHSLYFDGLDPDGAWWFHRVNGHLVSRYPIVPGFFNIPAYAIAMRRGVPLDQAHRSMLSMASASFVTAASVAFFFLAIDRLVKRRSTAIAAALLYAFATTAMSVAARGMWQHGPSLLFLTLALWLMTRGDPRSIALTGLPLGFAVFNRPVNLLIVAPLAAYVLWRHRRAFLPMCAAAAVPAALMAWYSIRYWGTVTALGQGLRSTLFSGSIGASMAGILVSPSRGLLIFTPLFLFSFAAMIAVLRRPAHDPFLTALATGVVLTLLLYGRWFMWWGGNSFGYRLLTELVPSLMTLLAIGWERFFVTRRFLYPLIGATAVISLYIHFLGAFYAPCGFDSVPNDINAYPERLWWWTDNEIVRCSDKFTERLRGHLQR